MFWNKNEKPNYMYVSNEIDFSNITTSCFLKDAQIYTQYGVRYLRLVYQYEDDNGIHELTIPQVEFPFGNRLNLKHIYGAIPAQRRVSIRLCTEGDVANVYLHDTKSHDGLVYYTDKIIKRKPKKMTIEEIEQKLGYKVEIVSSKKEK